MSPTAREFIGIIKQVTARQKRAKSITRAVTSQRECKMWKEFALWSKRCIDCKIADPFVLDFYPEDDKSPKESGRRTVNQYKNSGNINAMREEIKRSVVRCYNCQARHMAELGVVKSVEERKQIIADIQKDAERGLIKRKRAKVTNIR